MLSCLLRFSYMIFYMLLTKPACMALGWNTPSKYVASLEDLLIVIVIVWQATVKEALMFSARLRLDSSVSDAQVRQYVDEVIGIVELLPIQNKMVGMPKVSGLSVEQRKRLTIAVELVANPSVVFMDEPTSGEQVLISDNTFQHQKCWKTL